MALLGLTTGTAAAAEDVESIPVSFDVVINNHSGIPCATSGVTDLLGGLLSHSERATVRGHLTGPADKLHNGVEGALYSHGDGYGEYFWRYPPDRDYNVVDDLAGRGHVSVTFDRLGYGDSDKPNGNDICFGTEADVLHQIIGQLRDGSYHGDRTPSFRRVALVGHSASGIIVEQEAAGFGDIDALGVLSSGELNAGPVIAERTAQTQLRCLTAANGYAPLEGSEAEFRADHFHNIDPDIADKIARRRTDDACAGTRNAAQAIVADPIRNGMITVPVLLLVGENDALFSGNPAPQAATYIRSSHVSLVQEPDTGHALAFGRTAPRVRDDLHHWLDTNGF